MNYNETLGFIHSLGMFSFPAGLERITDVLKKLGDPQNNLKAVHIAGTNGKGSVSAMLSSVFSAAGYKTGLYTSPFIIDFRERIQIDGEYISETDICRFAETVKNTGVRLTEFEFITAMAFAYFKEQKIDILVCETGLGGRFDATNTLDNLLCAVITKIGLDHTAVLGNTVEKIAAEKCGILRDCPAVTSPYQDERALKVISERAKRLTVPDISKLEVLCCGMLGNKFSYKGKEYEIELCGEFQIENAVTAIEAINCSGLNIPYETVRKGMKTAFIPARMEVMSRSPLIVLDGAHNPDGANALASELRKFGGKVTAVIGMMKDKDCKKFLENTLCYCTNAVSTEVKDNARSLSAEELCEIASKFCNCTTSENLQDAIEKAVKISEGGPVFIFGSLYLASAARPILKEKF